MTGKPLTITAAAKRVHRSKRTLERWIADGDLEIVVVRGRDGNVIRYVRIEKLLATYRAKLAADPTRAKIRDDVIPP